MTELILRLTLDTNALGPFSIYTGSTSTTPLYTGVTRNQLISGFVIELEGSLSGVTYNLIVENNQPDCDDNVVQKPVIVFIPPTPTPTPSITPTNTPQSTPCATFSPTPTNTPTQTITPSITPTNTITPSITPTNTITPSITATNTPTNTTTPTCTITPSTTPTITPTITPSQLPYKYEVGGMVPCCGGSSVEQFIGSNTPLNLGDIISINLGGGIKCYTLVTSPTLLPPGTYSPIFPVVNIYLDCETCIVTYPCLIT